MYNRQTDELEQLEAEGKIFVFRPDTMEGIGRTESDAKVLEALYFKGVEIARSRLPELREYLNK